VKPLPGTLGRSRTKPTTRAGPAVCRRRRALTVRRALRPRSRWKHGC